MSPNLTVTKAPRELMIVSKFIALIALFGAGDAYSDKKVAEVTSFSGTLNVYK